jgi:hypothetical protein
LFQLPNLPLAWGQAQALLNATAVLWIVLFRMKEPKFVKYIIAGLALAGFNSVLARANHRSVFRRRQRQPERPLCRASNHP